ncbi:monovalent cation:proton antiporter-2 (CPA2) family protein [Neisseria chenwenguii]|uniref:Potassium transporter n=1 Tax=Neisseria chenwenguii TaxID=1853278 RepID=A0A220RZ85_9NEIS|nr:monovalent cation:proton antiporter-2 (CPA2) family protein [Neisseria chenwenguii]ASK26426.1 potassium transporter [Neisseria chenwenguii]ROV55848.1 potassium transporter [Neisseria chenwenguii]
MAAEHAGGLIQVVALLGAAVVAVPLFKRLGLGSVLGYLVAGVAIGPFGAGLFNDTQAVLQIAELGVVIFLFVIGLEMKPAQLWHLRKQIFGVGALQVGVALAALTAVITAAGYPWKTALVGAAGFVLTSTAVVMSALGERNMLSGKNGQSMVSVLLFEDLMIVPLLALIPMLSPNQAESTKPLWQAVGTPLLCLAAVVFAGLYLLNPLFRLLARFKAREVMTAAALFVVLGSALLMETGGLSMAMGAFVAGVLLSESSFRHQLEADVEPFRGLLLGLFFLAVGMSLDLKVVWENWQTVLLGVLVLVDAAFICIYAVARLTKSSHQEALERAAMMALGGEFAFVLYGAAVQQGVIDSGFNAQMTAVIVLSMALNPLLVMAADKFLSVRKEERPADEIDEQHPVILVGMGRFGQIVRQVLSAAGYRLTIIDLDEELVSGFSNVLDIKTYFGDASRPELLVNAGIEKAELLIVAIDDPEKSLQIIGFARSINPDIKIVARAYDRMHTYRLYEKGVEEIVRETFDSAVRSSKAALRQLGMPAALVEEVGSLYFKLNRTGMERAAVLYDPDIPSFTNQALIDEVKRQNRYEYETVQELIGRYKMDNQADGDS